MRPAKSRRTAPFLQLSYTLLAFATAFLTTTLTTCRRTACATAPTYFKAGYPDVETLLVGDLGLQALE